MSQSYIKEVSIPKDFVLVSATTVGTDTLLSTLVGSSRVRGLLVGVAGYLDVVMENGVTRTGLPFVVGLNPGAFKTVKTSTGGGAATNVWVCI